MFRRKTAPAFEVALRLGALYAGLDAHEEVVDVLRTFSEALGIAYQIRDDLSDLGEQGETNDIASLRPSLLLAVAHERASEPAAKEATAMLWQRQFPSGLDATGVETLYVKLKADERCRALLETYKEEAIPSLRHLWTPTLKD